jgi:hypothetical protein
MKRFHQRSPYRVTMNEAFAEVIDGCATTGFIQPQPRTFDLKGNPGSFFTTRGAAVNHLSKFG